MTARNELRSTRFQKYPIWMAFYEWDCVLCGETNEVTEHELKQASHDKLYCPTCNAAYLMETDGDIYGTTTTLVLA